MSPADPAGARAFNPRVVTIGETMIMFAPPRDHLLERSTQYTSYVAGAEANVAIGLERLGIHSGWIGRLPDNPVARNLVREIRSHGVDTDAAIFAPAGRLGVLYFEFASPPRPPRLVYDRSGSAATMLQPDDLDWDYISAAEWLHLTGITPALSETCRSATAAILTRAKRRGLSVSFDINYRQLLWDRPTAQAALSALLPLVDLLIGTEADIEMLAGGSGNRRDTLVRLYDRYQLEAVVMTLGTDGAIAYDGSSAHSVTGHRATVVNRLGAGDAFAAGLLYGRITSGLTAGLEYGSAMAALKLTIPDNVPLVSKADVDNLISGASPDLIR